MSDVDSVLVDFHDESFDLDAYLSSVLPSETKKKRKKNRILKNPNGILYFGHLPVEFQEKELKGFLKQFGRVKNVRVSRSKTTQRPRGYAFVQFESDEIADIVQKTMNGYMIGDKTLAVSVVRKEKAHERMFFNSTFEKNPLTSAERQAKVHNRSRTSEAQEKRHAKLLAKDVDRRAKLAEMGIDYDFDGYADDGGNTKKAKKKRKISSAKASSSSTKKTRSAAAATSTAKKTAAAKQRKGVVKAGKTSLVKKTDRGVTFDEKLPKKKVSKTSSKALKIDRRPTPPPRRKSKRNSSNK